MGHRQNQDRLTPIGSDFGFNKIADWITLAVRLTPNRHYSQGLSKVGGRWRKSRPTWLVSVSYSA